MEQRRTLAKLLRTLADLVERSPEADLNEVIEGRASLVISVGGATKVTKQGTRPDTEKRRQPSTRDLTGVVAQLRQLESREAGFKFLTSSQMTKRELEAMARSMDLPVVREDDIEQLKRKIVEESIGSRLNSQAIRGQ